MEQFKLVSKYSPMGDQPAAIQQLVDGIRAGKKEQVLLGGTGTGNRRRDKGGIPEGQWSGGWGQGCQNLCRCKKIYRTALYGGNDK